MSDIDVLLGESSSERVKLSPVVKRKMVATILS